MQILALNVEISAILYKHTHLGTGPSIPWHVSHTHLGNFRSNAFRVDRFLPPGGKICIKPWFKLSWKKWFFLHLKWKKLEKSLKINEKFCIMTKFNISECCEIVQLSHESVRLRPLIESHILPQSDLFPEFFTLSKNAKTNSSLIMSDHLDANASTKSNKAQPLRAASSRSGERDPLSAGSDVSDCHSTSKVADSLR